MKMAVVERQKRDWLPSIVIGIVVVGGLTCCVVAVIVFGLLGGFDGSIAAMTSEGFPTSVAKVGGVGQTMPTATVVPAQVEVTAVVQPAGTATGQPISQATQWPLYENEGGIPYDGSTFNVDVAPDEIEVLTAGPAVIAGIELPGGVDRGSIIILLPDRDKVVSYKISGLIPGANWHGSYRPIENPASEANWRALANDRVLAMQVAPNCTSGTGCTTIDVLVIGPSGVIAQWVVTK